MIKNGKDFWAGLMFLGIGIFFMIASRAFPMGSAVRMGPAYFPTVLGGLLTVLGFVVFLRAFLSKIPYPVNVFPFRGLLLLGGAALAAVAWMSGPWFAEMGGVGFYLHKGLSALALFLIMGAFGPPALLIVLIATVAFGYLLKPFGLVAVTGMLIFVSAWAGFEFKFREVAILFVVMAIFSVYVFVHALGLPFNVWPDLG